MSNHLHRIAMTALAVAMVSTISAFGVTAYDVPSGTDGNQAFGGALGTSFNVNHVVIVTDLGAFDDDSNGIAAGTTLTTNLWDRSTQTLLATDTFTAASPGTLEDAYRFKATTPIFLPINFQGMIATGGYNAAEENGNQGVSALTLTENTGGGLVTYVQDNRFRGDGNPSLFPTNADGGPATRYLAGNFKFEAANIAYEIAAGTVGNQAFTGSLGMDFETNASTAITHLGAFDSGGDGIDGTITVQLWSREGTPSLLAETTFTGDEGDLIGGSRFKPISEATFFNGFNGLLSAETDATIVAFGYSDLELNGNGGGAAFGNVFDGDGLLTFEGTGRFGAAGAFPGTADGGPANRYGAGTFRFSAVPEPTTAALLAFGCVAALRRRRQTA